MQKISRLYEQFIPETYTISWHLDTVEQDGIIRANATIIGEQLDPGMIRLHAKDLTFDEIRINNAVAEAFTNEENDVLAIKRAGTGKVEISLSYTIKVTDAMHGIYPCYFKEGDVEKKLYATQFESHHAREAFPCIDEPEAKAIFYVTLRTKPDVTALSNMPVKLTNDSETPGVEQTSYEPTPRMSPYLLAFVVGDLQKQSAKTKSGVEVNVWATRAQSADSLAFPLVVAVGSIDFFDDYFGIPYPLPKADHVALPDFSSGAMENWGLITYREIALLVDENSSVSMREYVATVIAHETSHQWFGNLVTMKWWDDLWLNESFATIMEYVAVDALYPQWQTWNTFASQETLSALRRDQLSGVQAVKTEVNHPDEISTIFDPSIVYAKGGRLLKMLRSYIGDTAFREGLRAYFQEHAYKNTVGADLWRAFSQSSGKDIELFMSTWISQSGFPLVSVTTTDTGYTLTQERFVLGAKSDDSLWPIPLFSTNAQFPELLEQREVMIKAAHSLPLLNQHNDAHFIAHYDEAAWEYVLEALARDELSPVTRLSLLHETSLLARGGKADSATLIPLLGAYSQESSEPVWNIISMVIGDLKRFVEEDETGETNLKKLVTSIALPQYERLGFDQRANEPEQDTKLRATILGLLAYAEYQPVLDLCLNAFHDTTELERLPSEIRGVVLSVAAKHGTTADFDRLLSVHESTPNAELRDDVTSGLCTSRRSESIERLLGRLKNASLVKRQDLFRWYIYLLRNRHARTHTWQWMTDNWSWIEEEFKGDKSYDDFARYSANVLATRPWLEQYVTFFGPMSQQTALKRAIEVGTIEIESRVQWIERDTESVRATLAAKTA